MRFENGAQGIVTVTHASAEPKDTLDIYGTKGAINVKNVNKGIMDVTIDGKTHSQVIQPEPNRYTSLIDEFSHAILEDRSPLANASIGLRVNELLEQIYKT
jgi:predicted dehydrogenase